MEPDHELEKLKIVISFGKKKTTRKFSIKPPGGGLIFFQALLRGDLKERGGVHLI